MTARPSKKVSLILLKISSYIVQTKLISPILENLWTNFLMGLKINFKFEILGILVQNPHIQQDFSKSPYSAGLFFDDQKSFSDFAENFVIYSSDKINFANFGKSAKQLSYGFKKSIFILRLWEFGSKSSYSAGLFLFKIHIFRRYFFLFKIPIFSRREVLLHVLCWSSVHLFQVHFLNRETKLIKHKILKLTPYESCFRRLPSGDKIFWHFSFRGGNSHFKYPSWNQRIRHKILKWTPYGFCFRRLPSGNKVFNN